MIGMNFIDTGLELHRQRRNSRDFLVNSRDICLQSNSNGKSRLLFKIDNKIHGGCVDETAHEQLAEKLKIPHEYYQRMQREDHDLLDINVNRWLEHGSEFRLIRMLDGRVRAFLSSQYMRLDNLDVYNNIAPMFYKMTKQDVAAFMITPERLYIKIVLIKSAVAIQKNDIVARGILISNSEVGRGNLRVELFVYRLACENGLILPDAPQKKFRKVHRGAPIKNPCNCELPIDFGFTQEACEIFDQIRSIVHETIVDARFENAVEQLRESSRIPIEDAYEWIARLAKKFRLDDDERLAIRMQVPATSTLTLYDMINAVTASAHFAKNYKRAIALERLGGEILNSLVH